MEEQDVEKRLKEDAQKIEVKDFSESWSVIKAAIESEEEATRVEVPYKQKVYATVGGGNSNGVTQKKLLLSFGIVVLFIALCLAIILPLTLHKGEKLYLELKDLTTSHVSPTEYIDEIQKSDIPVVDLSDFVLNECDLFLDKNGIAQGGKTDAYDIKNEAAFNLVFYSSIINTEWDIVDTFSTYKVNNVNIKYLTEFDDVLYTSTIFADSGNVKYKIIYRSATDNVLTFFEDLFA